ncbi:hypothetical protein COY90_01860 [Candidatus Roizmanbacteria bacterium CG_4_10_14_0_8_um_filter_39_9]|uniref:ParB/Spo0J HTH domain-containing protein n=1 Tax=Candidatus Roizmanbacteria bacterium CG_4_10_14_0_8_um_filter_39_9 TaxID=1974829 RepID=A0A2M7QDA5_9BACT|nr:MAG: hypothetical protein COY90_01860 [Candidatus Roizmanbacteria bacterium CG_4_10_14_0_8_um_filter_39_9]
MQTDIVSVVGQIKNETNFITKAKLLRFLVVDKGIRIKDISRTLGMKESYVCHILRLNKLNDLVVDGYYSKLISISHLFIIARLHTTEQIEKAYEMVLGNSFTVSQTEELIREMLYQTKTVGEHMEKKEIDLLTHEIEIAHDVKVKVVQTRIKTKCLIEISGSLQDATPRLRSILKILGETQKVPSKDEDVTA